MIMRGKEMGGNWARTGSKVLALTVVALLSVCPMFLPQASARTYPTTIMRTFKDGNITENMDFTGPGKQTTRVRMDEDSVVFNATVQASPRALTLGGLDYPRAPSIDLGSDGTKDWAYSGLGYGRWGLQDVFNDNSTKMDFTFEANDSRAFRFKIPKDARPLGGSFMMSGAPDPFWGPQFIVSTTKSESPVEANATMTVFKGMLYVAWQTMDPAVSGGTTQAIVYRTYDGHNWGKIKLLSYLGDTYEDQNPFLVVYKDKLYCLWQAAEAKNFYANDDLYMRYTGDGANWSGYQKISPTKRSGMNQWPAAAVFQDMLYIFWRTTDPTISEVSTDTDLEIVYRTWDGTNLGPFNEITKGDNGATDWSFDMAVYNNRLYIIWETVTGGFLNLNSYYDIVYRSFDGTSWTDRKTITSNDNLMDTVPRALVWLDPIKKMDMLYVVWGRGSVDNEAGTGYLDIVFRSFDGSKWTSIQTISQTKSSMMNTGQRIVDYNGKLFVAWVEERQSVFLEDNGDRDVYWYYGNVNIRAFDGNAWNGIMELTPTEHDNLAKDVALCAFDNKLFAGWSMNNYIGIYSQDWDIAMRVLGFQDVFLDVDIGNDGTVDWSGELSSPTLIIPMNATAVGKATKGGSITDAYNNRITEVTVGIRSRNPARVSVTDLMVEYDHRVTLDLASRLTRMLDDRRSGQNGSGGMNLTGYIELPITVGTGSEGGMDIENLSIEYIINHPPFQIQALPTVTMQEDTTLPDALDLQDYFSDDWDGGNLQFRIVSMDDPNHLEAELNGSKIGFTTPTDYWFGQSNVTVVAMDNFGLRGAPVKVRVNVTWVNHPPVLDFIPDQTVKVGERFEYKATAHDIDYWQKLTFSNTGDLFRINKDSGSISFTPAHKGKYTLNVSVSDGFLEARQNVTITIIGETASGTSTTCFTLVGVIIIVIAIVLVAFKVRQEMAWNPVKAERLSLEEEEDEGSKAKGAGKGRPKGKVPRKVGPRRAKGSFVIPGTDVTYDKYTVEKEDVKVEPSEDAVKVVPKRFKRGSLDDEEWRTLTEELERRKEKRREDLKAKTSEKKEDDGAK